MNYPNGDQYEGQFKDGERHGFGILTSQNGDKYEGKWEEGAKSGYGREYIANIQEYYEGQFDRDKRDLQGKIITNKGEIYDTIYNKGQLTKRSAIPVIMNKKKYEKMLGNFLKKQAIIEPKIILIP